MEGDARVEGDMVIYDPQAPKKPKGFRANGSHADELAIVLNVSEMHALGHSNDELDAVGHITRSDGANVIVVKAGAQGCRIYVDAQPVGTVPPYRSESVYKIGTGDVFSATFAYHWAIEKKDALEAADAASRCVARYSASRYPSVLLNTETESLVPVQNRRRGKVYVAGPFFTLADLWLIEEAWTALRELGVDVFSPFHDVGYGTPEEVVRADLKELRNCTAMLAILDGCDSGTLFEVGYAVKAGIPVIALAQNLRASDTTMLAGSTQCHIVNDFATAVYHATWKASE